MKYLILGASAAGLNAVRAIRQFDAAGDITVLSRDRQIYSRCLLPEVLAGKKDAMATRFVPEDFMERYGVRWFGGVEATRLLAEEKAVLANTGDKFSYDRLLISTGASSFLPPVENIHKGRQIYGLRNMEDVEAISAAAKECRSAVIMGGGLVGVDAAVALNERGIPVTVIEAAGHILPLQLDRRAAERYQHIFRKRGIEIITGEMVNRILLDGDDNVTAVELKGGRIIPCGMVVAAAGVTPNISFLEGTTVETGRGIRVNEYQETSLVDVFAAGDVCESLEVFTKKITTTPIWPLAVQQGRVAGWNMTGVRRKPSNNFAFRNSMEFYGLPAVSYGLIEAPGPGYETFIEERGESYKKFILKNGQIRGAILQGDISGAGVYGALIRENIPAGVTGERLFGLTYADFFNQREDGSFIYSDAVSG